MRTARNSGPERVSTPNMSLPAHEGGSGPGGSTCPPTQNYFVTRDQLSENTTWDKGDDVARCETSKMGPSIKKEKIIEEV